MAIGRIHEGDSPSCLGIEMKRQPSCELGQDFKKLSLRISKIIIIDRHKMM